MSFDRLKDFIPSYPDPSFEEMLRLCVNFGIISDYEASVFGVRFTCVDEVMEMSVDEAEVAMKGLLLGFFFAHSRDNLREARWQTSPRPKKWVRAQRVA